MSTWITIKDQENVDFDSPISEETIDVIYSRDAYGANYVSIPVKFIIEVLKEHGYEVRRSDETYPSETQG